MTFCCIRLFVRDYLEAASNRRSRSGWRPGRPDPAVSQSLLPYSLPAQRVACQPPYSAATGTLATRAVTATGSAARMRRTTNKLSRLPATAR